MLTLEVGNGFFDGPIVNAVVLVTIALLMISRVPTFSIKQIKLKPSYRLPALLLVVLLIAALASAPLTTLICGGVVYLLSIPVSVWMQMRDRRRVADAPLPAPSLPPSSPTSTTPHPDTG
jgi:CDP-diacylglycerol--serine O-phosphatidyltransferase